MMKMYVPPWVIAVAVAVPLSGAGGYALHNVYVSDQVVKPVIEVDVNEEELSGYIVEGLHKRNIEQRKADDEAGDKALCHSLRGWPGMKETGACP